jgi:hypothetical protein
VLELIWMLVHYPSTRGKRLFAIPNSGIKREIEIVVGYNPFISKFRLFAVCLHILAVHDMEQ